jgi:methylenetetrahydrofolate dehydrogenase (NADP+)/methenyltetrahydrofolate cyclohydrolase
MQIIDGKKASEFFISALALETESFFQETGIRPHLAAVLVGNSGPSETYVAAKMEACKKAGFTSSLIRFEPSISEDELLKEIDILNKRVDLHGFIVQLPLPEHISVDRIIEAIDPAKDVDGFHPVNFGKLAKGQKTFVPATPLGIMKLLEHYQIETSGKHAVVLGRSQIVGLPMGLLLSANTNPGNCTVTICHSKTKELLHFTKQADILVAALGKPEFVTGDMVKTGVVVIDVGISRIPDATKKSGYRIAGDVHYESVSAVAGAITHVPGGVGPRTIVALMQNTLSAARASQKRV